MIGRLGFGSVSNEVNSVCPECDEVTLMRVDC